MKNKYTEIPHANPMLQPGTKAYKKGGCIIFVSPPHGDIGWHVTISRKNRLPSWQETRDAWYELVPDAENRVAVMILPKAKDYINLHEYCFQIHEQKDVG